MLSPLSRGYGTWTGNYDPYNEEGAVSFKISCNIFPPFNTNKLPLPSTDITLAVLFFYGCSIKLKKKIKTLALHFQ
jgi:hypothetical protein